MPRLRLLRLGSRESVVACIGAITKLRASVVGALHTA
jgi:hypothetical protein